MSLNIVKHNFRVTKNNREAKQGHKSYLLWFTGLSGSGKSTLANLVEIKPPMF
jgi:adenylylsulfate kinase